MKTEEIREIVEASVKMVSQFPEMKINHKANAKLFPSGEIEYYKTKIFELISHNRQYGNFLTRSWIEQDCPKINNLSKSVIEWMEQHLKHTGNDRDVYKLPSDFMLLYLQWERLSKELKEVKKDNAPKVISFAPLDGMCTAKVKTQFIGVLKDLETKMSISDTNKCNVSKLAAICYYVYCLKCDIASIRYIDQNITSFETFKKTFSGCYCRTAPSHNLKKAGACYEKMDIKEKTALKTIR